jgi:hypothetical protein
MEKALIALFLAALPGLGYAAELMLKPSQYHDAQNPAAIVTPTQPTLSVPMPTSNTNDFKLKGNTASLEIDPKWQFKTTLTADQYDAIQPSAGPQPKLTMGLNYKF